MLSPENFPTILGHEPIAASAIADTADAICLKNAKGVLITILFAVNSDSDWTLTVHEGATAAEAAAGTYPITTGKEFPVWVNLDAANTDALVRLADALGYVVDTGVYAGKLIVVCFYIPAANLTSNRSWIALGAAGGGTGLASVLYQIDGERYAQATPPTAIA